MNEKELTKNVDKIKQLLTQSDYDKIDAGFELLITLDSSELIEALTDTIQSCLVIYYKNNSIEEAFELASNLNILNTFQMYLAKVSSIDSGIIKLLNNRNDLDNTTKKMVEFKLSLLKIYNSNIQENFTGLSISSPFKNIEKIIFPEEFLSDLYESARFEFCNSHFEKTNLIAKRDSCGGCRIVVEQSSFYFKCLILNNPNCPVNLLNDVVNDGDKGYESSLLKKAVAKNQNTSKKLIESLLSDKYRWVRKAAASHMCLKKNDISKLIEKGDRYILEGLQENVNCDENIIKTISNLLKDEESYPLEYTTYTSYEPSDPGRVCGGVFPLNIVTSLLIEGKGESFLNSINTIGLSDFDDDEWDYKISEYTNFYEATGALSGPGNEITILYSDDSEEEYIECGLDIELGSLGNDDYDIYRFNSNKYDPNNFKSLKNGTFFFWAIFNDEGYGENHSSFNNGNELQLEIEINPWEILRHYKFHCFQSCSEWGDEHSVIEDYYSECTDGKLYVKDGENNFSEINLKNLYKEISENLEDSTDSDAVGLHLEKKYSQ